MGRKVVFISYSHDSPEHRERGLGLSERLRLDGLKTVLDQYVNGSPEQTWPRWMLDEVEAADRVLVVCTETYYRRFRGHEEAGKGKDVLWALGACAGLAYESSRILPQSTGATGRSATTHASRSVIAHLFQDLV